MKFDRETLIGIAICLVVLFGWEPFAKWMGWLPASPPAAVIQQPAAGTVPKGPETSSVSAPVPVPEPVPVVEIKSAPPLPPVTLANTDMELTIEPLTGSLRAVELDRYLNVARDANIVLDQTYSGTGALSLSDLATPWVTTGITESRLEKERYFLTREIRTSNGGKFRVSESWQIEAAGYETKYTFTILNDSDRPVSFSRLVLNGGDLAPWAKVSGDKVRIPSFRMDFMTVNGKFVDIKEGKEDSDYFRNPPPLVTWAGISNKYFSVLLTAAEPFTLYQKRQIHFAGKVREETMSVGAAFPAFLLNPGEKKSQEFRYYSGPKVIALLDSFDPSTARVMHLAWGPLDYLARLLLWILVKLQAVCGSYGISIIILTLLVRLLFYPVTAKANASMKKMQAVGPKLKELRDKYKDNPQLLNTKTMELYRAEGVNPFGGCLPILLQIPVFFALYATLDGAVELRQVPFLWAHDLAAADTVARIPLFLFGWSLPINPLVIAMTVLMVIQQHMTPMSLDPIQKKMMTLMPVVMLVILYDLPSGLTLYWTVSNLFSIIQLRLQQRNSQIVQGSAPVGKDAK